MSELTDKLLIGYNVGFVTVSEKRIRGPKHKEAGEEYYGDTLTFKDATAAVRGVKRRFGIVVDVEEVEMLYQAAKLAYLIEQAKKPPPTCGFKKKGS